VAGRVTSANTAKLDGGVVIVHEIRFFRVLWENTGSHHLHLSLWRAHWWWAHWWRGRDRGWWRAGGGVGLEGGGGRGGGRGFRGGSDDAP
jgi:hypothetical protein